MSGRSSASRAKRSRSFRLVVKTHLLKGSAGTRTTLRAVALDEQELVVAGRPGEPADLLDLPLRQPEVDPKALDRLAARLADELRAAVADDRGAVR